jgi:hypothetical protein
MAYLSLQDRRVHTRLRTERNGLRRHRSFKHSDFEYNDHASKLSSSRFPYHQTSAAPDVLASRCLGVGSCLSRTHTCAKGGCRSPGRHDICRLQGGHWGSVRRHFGLWACLWGTGRRNAFSPGYGIFLCSRRGYVLSEGSNA